MRHNDSDLLEKHSPNYIEMALKKDNMKRVRNPDGYGKRVGECGDTIELFLTCHDNTLKTVSYFTQGCLHTVACCNTVVMLAQGKTIDKAWEILPEEITLFLETLPLDHTHCAELAVGALYLALTNFKSKNDKI
jgi:nitrogen fixation NifU-like protein